MRGLLLFVVLALGTTSVSLTADTYPRQPALDAIHYRFDLAIDKTARVRGTATVTLRVLAPVAHVDLDLVSATNGKGMAVSAVRVDGQVVTGFTHATNRLRIPLPAGLTAGRDIDVAVTYEGLPADGLKAVTNIHGAETVFSQNWPDRARHWLPMIDHPYDKATGDLLITTSAEQQVVSNGSLVEERDLGAGQRRTHWRQSVPIASWLYAVGIAQFDVHHAGHVQGVPLQTWVFPEDRDAGRGLFEETSRRAMDFFSQRVGPFPYEKLANVQAAGAGGGMENATTIFYGEKGVASGRGPVVHEIAHQWFGNSVTERDWDDVWLSEGFATYFALLYTEQFEGREAFKQGLDRSRTTVLGLEAKLPDTPVIHRNLSDMSRVLNQFVYQKGGWVLHMLRTEIGDDAFWAGIREYYRRYRDSHATTADLRQVMERAGGRDLGWFFDQWLTRAGVPRVDGRWRYVAEQKQVELTVSQTHASGVFRLPVAVAITTASGTRIERVVLDATERRVTFASDAAPSRLVFDPDVTLLARFGELISVP